jgi:hypothetical protein
VIAGDDYTNPAYGGCTAAWDQFDRQVGGLHRDGLVWAIKVDRGPYVPIYEAPMRATNCASCHRVVWDTHVDGERRCVFCAQPPAQGSEVARPAEELSRVSRLVLKEQGE